MFQQLKTIIPGFALDTRKSNRILVEDSNGCRGDWMNLYLLEVFLRDTESRVLFVASQ